MAPALLLQPGDDLVDALTGVGEHDGARERSGVNEHARAGIGLGHRVGVKFLALRLDDDPNGEVVGASEFEVSLVVRGHRHDRPGAVVAEDVIGGPHRDLLAVDRVDRHRRQRHAVPDPLRGHPLDLGLPSHLLEEVHERPLELAPGHQLRDQRVLRGQDEERRTPERVRPGGEHRVGHRRQVGPRRDHLEGHLGPPAPTDPVPLLDKDLVRPLEQLHVVDQAVRVVRDLEEPLGQVPHLGHGAAAPADPRRDLLVGQHRLVDRTPVDRRRLSVGQSPLQQLEEDPLVPAVVAGVGADDLTVPVVGEAEARLGAAHLLDVGEGPFLGMHPPLDGSVLCGEAEGVVAHGVEDVVALHPPLPGDGVRDGVVLHVPHVHVARGVREHLQDVALARRIGVRGGGMGLLPFPGRDPPLLKTLGIVALLIGGNGHRGIGYRTDRPPSLSSLLGHSPKVSSSVRPSSARRRTSASI